MEKCSLSANVGVGEAEQIHVSIAGLGNLLNPFRDFDLIFSLENYLIGFR